MLEAVLVVPCSETCCSAIVVLLIDVLLLSGTYLLVSVEPGRGMLETVLSVVVLLSMTCCFSL